MYTADNNIPLFDPSREGGQINHKPAHAGTTQRGDQINLPLLLYNPKAVTNEYPQTVIAYAIVMDNFYITT